MPQLSRRESSFGLSSKSSINSVSSAIFDRFRGFGTASKQQKLLEERYRRPLTLRNVETFVEDQRIDDACGGKNRSIEVQISFWVRQLPECCQEAINETQIAMNKDRPTIEGGIAIEDLPEGGSYSESLLAAR